MSISFRFRGRVSRISLPRQSENDKGYYKAHKAEQVHGRRDDGDAVGVRVQPEPVAERRAVVGREDRRSSGHQTSKGADPDHHEKSRARPPWEEHHGYEVRSPPDEHVDACGEDVGEREVFQGRELRYPTRLYKAQVDLRGEAAREDAAEGAALLQKRRQEDAQGKERRELLLAVLQRDADQDGHGPRHGQDRKRFGQDALEVLDAHPEAVVRRGNRRQDQHSPENRREDRDAYKVGSKDERGEGEDVACRGQHRGCYVVHVPAAGDREAGDEDRDHEQEHTSDDPTRSGYDDVVDDRELRLDAE